MIRGGVCDPRRGQPHVARSRGRRSPRCSTTAATSSRSSRASRSRAHPDFRIVATMNDDARPTSCPSTSTRACSRRSSSTSPSATRRWRSSRENLPFADDAILDYVTRLPAGRPRGRRALHRARRHQHRALRAEAAERRRRQARGRAPRRGHARARRRSGAVSGVSAALSVSLPRETLRSEPRRSGPPAPVRRGLPYPTPASTTARYSVHDDVPKRDDVGPGHVRVPLTHRDRDARGPLHRSRSTRGAPRLGP